MSNTQQEVFIYKETLFTTAQRQFERDLAKRQREGWRLVSITPTNKTFGRITQLTAIYARETPYSENTPLNKPHVSNPQKQTPQPTTMPPPPPYLWEQAPSSAAPLAYNKTIFFGLLIITVISIMLIGFGSDTRTVKDHFSLLISRAGAALFLGVLISVLIMDWKGFVSLEGLIKWRQMGNIKRIGMGCLFFFFFPIFFFIYLIRAGLNVFQSEGPIFSQEWDAPKPIKQRAKIGLITGIVFALISLTFSTSAYSTGTNVNSISKNRTPTADATAVGNISNSTSPPATTSTPKSKPSPTATSMPTAKPSPTAIPYARFGDGMYVVGKDIQPGTYRTRVASSHCYYARLSGFGGTIDDIIANDNTNTPAIVTISPTDKGFQSSRCGTWTKDLSAITTSQTSFEDGMYIIGTDIQPGTYKNSGQSRCYYARLSGFGGTIDDIIANDNTDALAIVTISPTDKGFQSSRCGTWTKV